jgi:chaperone required for assembly of F1-ATPase
MPPIVPSWLDPFNRKACLSVSLRESGGSMALKPLVTDFCEALDWRDFVAIRAGEPPPGHLAAVQDHAKLMREIFSEIFENKPLDPTEAARRAGRFYSQAVAGDETDDGIPVLLDGRPIKTPAGRPFAAPTRELAEALAAEWNAQKDQIDPARMPLTRLANAVIDAVVDQPQSVADEIANYLGSDLVLYRADTPQGLIARQAELWDPLLRWAHETHGARFVTVEGVMFAAQPAEAIAAVRRAIPREPWRLGALSSIASLTGSALIALALSAEALDVDAAWAAAHVDEDWQMAQWGRDELALNQRAYREAELRAAADVLRLTD